MLKHLVFHENEIIQYKNLDGFLVTERIIWVEEDSDCMATIDINDNKALPVITSKIFFEDLLEQKLLIFVKDDPYKVYKIDSELSDKEKTLRDERWNMIKDIVVFEPDIFSSNKRGRLVSIVVEKTGVSKVSVYKCLRLYWQRGKTKNALLPDYYKSGGAGNERELGSKKTGRPRKFLGHVGEGINITPEIKRVFHVSVKKYYHNSKKNPLTTTYNLMLKDFFVEYERYEGGVKKVVLKNQNELPTIEQFRYWYKNNYSLEEKHKKRKGTKKFFLEDRPTLSSSTLDVYGPGAVYQIDATVGDVYLVSEYDRTEIIGRPVIYIVIDSFSRMVVGVYVGLEGPSWIGAMMALYNTATDKVKYCKEYGINLENDDWPVNHFPQSILADRGEFEGYNPEQLINAFGIKISNTPPYRADWKGIVEQHFRTINLRGVKPFLPGSVDVEFRKRGDKDYRLDAKLTLKEFTQVIIRCILFHNNQHWLKSYNPNKFLISDDVPLIPRDLWNWGIRNRSGKLKTYPEDVIMLNILPTASASVTDKGIFFEKKHYSCERALRENWFSTASIKGHWKVSISYDPRNASYIYIRNEDGRSFEKCSLLEKDYKFRDITIEEVRFLTNLLELREKKYEHKHIQSQIDLISEVQDVIKKAENASPSVKGQSKKSRLGGIRDNRSKEKLANRDKEAFELDKKATEEEAIIKEFLPKKTAIEEEEEEYVYPKTIDLLRKMQKEKLSNVE